MAQLTAREVAQYAGIQPVELTEIEQVAAAVESLLISWGYTAPWDTHTRLGAIMLAGRVYRRRNSPAGVEAMGELGPVYVQRNDPDIAQLLGLGRYARPQVG